MSTRCQIAIFENDVSAKLDDIRFLTEKWEVLLYRQSGGYPESIISDILPFIQEFNSIRGHDPEYLGACLVAYLKYWHEGMPCRKIYSQYDLMVNINNFEIGILGHGISKRIHPDIEFLYIIDPQNLYVFDINFEGRHKKIQLIESHSIKADNSG